MKELISAHECSRCVWFSAFHRKVRKEEPDVSKPADADIAEDAFEAFYLLCPKNWGILTTDAVDWQGCLLFFFLVVQVTMKTGYQVFVTELCSRSFQVLLQVLYL